MTDDLGLTAGDAEMMDTDLPTLHIRCGSDIRDPLREAGFNGEFLEYSNPFCQGPVLDAPDFLQQRARFLAGAYGPIMGFTEAESLAELEQAERSLEAAHEHERVVLWFEHDSYDQLVLARCLASFANGARPAHLEMICIDRHPSVTRFIGLGQLKPAELALLWPVRKPVTNRQLDLGVAVWAALRNPEPLDLAVIAGTGTPALPIAAPALRRHLQDLPSAKDGLSMTQRLVLDLLREKPATIAQLFAALMQGREPLPFLGDLMFLHVVEQMALGKLAVIRIKAHEKRFARLVTITRTGHEVLLGRIDYLSLAPPERWVGGVVVDGRWRWDENTGSLAEPPRDV